MRQKNSRVALVVPTLNGGEEWVRWLEAMRIQRHRPERILVIDSSSSDGTPTAAVAEGCELITIDREDFSHGGTRQVAMEALEDMEVIIFMTQDAIFADAYALGKLLEAFADKTVGAVYGRQLPRKGAGVIEAHARLFNYPAKSGVVSMADVPRLGIKTAFLSNSFAAYRRVALQSAGGFQRDLILGEDTVVAARMLKSGWKISYCAGAQVFHSHNYSPWQEFQRYFDIGVLHSREAWLVDEFGKAGGEGRRYVISELRHLVKRAPWHIPEALVRSALKLGGYHLGLAESRLSVKLKSYLSLHKGYWKKHGERECAEGQ